MKYLKKPSKDRLLTIDIVTASRCARFRSPPFSRVSTAPALRPPSSGGYALIQLLRMKDDLSGEFAGQAHNSPQYIHLVEELEMRVFADRGVSKVIAIQSRNEADSAGDRRFTTFVLGGFATMALLLAGAGIYGVVAYAAASRTRSA